MTDVQNLIERLRGPVRQAASDLIAAYFGDTSKVLASIPARPDHDADLLLVAGISDAADALTAMQARAEKAEAELAEARAKNGALVEMAAEACNDYPREVPDWAEWPHYDDQIAHSQSRIRALDATAALEADRKRVRDEETRACAAIVRENSMSSMAGEKAILARIDQRKAEGRG